ncbi:MAG: hypothetical protein E7Z89_08860 [Cyanobacteria bacterium SIG28]|nr:hypothetical protein [Cyanobacteria bacterium SIG28]
MNVDIKPEELKDEAEIEYQANIDAIKNGTIASPSLIDEYNGMYPQTLTNKINTDNAHYFLEALNNFDIKDPSLPFNKANVLYHAIDKLIEKAKDLGIDTKGVNSARDLNTRFDYINVIRGLLDEVKAKECEKTANKIKDDIAPKFNEANKTLVDAAFAEPKPEVTTDGNKHTFNVGTAQVEYCTGDADGNGAYVKVTSEDGNEVTYNADGSASYNTINAAGALDFNKIKDLIEKVVKKEEEPAEEVPAE